MNIILKEIIERNRREAPELPVGRSSRQRKVIDAAASLRMKPFIAEIKKASPSAGEICSGVDVLAQAKYYRRGGAGAVSVLTEPAYFKGSIDNLKAVAGAIDLPVLCKDFIVHERQIERAHEAGADMVLLIAAILTHQELRRLTAIAGILGLSVLHEIHRIEEFVKLRGIDCTMVGVNARDLSTFTVDLPAAADTMRNLSGNFLKIAESGISRADDVRLMRSSGAQAFLVGSSLMKSGDPEGALRELYAGLD